MGALNNAAHHFELLRSCDSSGPFNNRCGECRPDGLERHRSNPVTIRLACILMALLPDQAWDLSVPHMIVSLFSGFVLFPETGMGLLKSRKPCRISLPGFRFLRVCAETSVGAGVNTFGKKNGQESLPLRKANPGRLAALWIGVLCGSGNHLLI